MIDPEKLCRTLCQSGKFETGEGGCASICMSELGSSRDGPHGCPFAFTVFVKLVEQIMRDQRESND